MSTRLLMKCVRYGFVAAWLSASLLWPFVVLGGDIGFQIRADAHAEPDRLHGHLHLQLAAPIPVYNVLLRLQGQGPVLEYHATRYWQPSQAIDIPYSLPSSHRQPGDYHLLVEIHYQTSHGDWLSSLSAISYTVRRNTIARHQPNLLIENQRLTWQLDDLDPASVSATFTSAPGWLLPNNTLRPADKQLELLRYQSRKLSPELTQSQLARLQWTEDGVHHSRIIPWTITTESSLRQRALEIGPWIAALLLAGLLLWQGMRKQPLAQRYQPWLARTLVLLITLWLAGLTHIGLWFTNSLSTGGDTASHVYYASLFPDWLASGKLSGWLPEQFAGFPAFSYYFPLPFIFVSLLAMITSLPIAFKLVSMSAGVLLPASCYLMGRLFGWPRAVRLLAATASAAFVVATGTSIWGGNLLAQLAGEFSYSWGVLFTVLFWGVLWKALRQGGRWWLLATLLEVALALCHGYALLMAGFAALLFPLFGSNVWRDLRLVLRVHLLAFLLLGFWLLPLIDNLVWTIPNDTSEWVDNLSTILPQVLWPFALGLLALPVVFLRQTDIRASLMLMLLITLLGLVGFMSASHFGLADIRFFPYAQWAGVVSLAVAIGWWLQQHSRSAVIWSALFSSALIIWWTPQTSTIQSWSQWNLEGYQAKALWPAYQQLANVLAGPLPAHRIAIEHDPDNNDLGSTRSMEALPMFGSRPVLEGLYMESAISGPFVYQLQAEISARPSSPLTRFPAQHGTVDQAIEHMRELYTDTLVLRSEAMKQRFSKDARFSVVAEPTPWMVIKLNDPASALIEPLSTPITTHTRDHWLPRAFQRFKLAHPYYSREVYLADSQRWPPDKASAKIPASVTVVRMEKERLVFETSAIGQPHLIRMSYHPRWQSLGGEDIYLTEPAFMLIIPKQSHVELIYANTASNYLGWAFSLIGLVLCATLFLSAQPTGRPHRPRMAVLAMATLLILLATLGWYYNPDRSYRAGHQLLNKQQWQQASDQFEQAYQRHHVPARKAEALFWLARNQQLGNIIAASQTYQHLLAQFPESYWNAEAYFRAIELSLKQSDFTQANELLDQLQTQHPESIWMTEAKKAMASQATLKHPVSAEEKVPHQDQRRGD